MSISLSELRQMVSVLEARLDELDGGGGDEGPFLLLAGGTMEGEIDMDGSHITGLPATPVAADQAVSKGHADAIAATRLPKSGGVVTGYITLHADPIGPMHAATMQYVDAQVGGGGLAAWPVGSIYIGITDVNPAVLLGGGTWVRFAQGRVLVSQDGSDPDFDTAREVGGAKTHTLLPTEMPIHTHIQNSHNHTQNSHNHTQDAHNHNLLTSYGGTTANPGNRINGGPSASPPVFGSNSGTGYTNVTIDSRTPTNNAATATNDAATATAQNAGSGLPHNNMQPWAVVYMWERTL